MRHGEEKPLERLLRSTETLAAAARENAASRAGLENGEAEAEDDATSYDHVYAEPKTTPELAALTEAKITRRYISPKTTYATRRRYSYASEFRTAR